MDINHPVEMSTKTLFKNKRDCKISNIDLFPYFIVFCAMAEK